MSDNKKIHPLSYIWLPVIVANVIFYLSCLITPSDMPDVGFDFFIETDKLVHFCMYFGLAGVASFYYIYLNDGKIIILKMLLFAVLLPILYGGIIEILQANYFNREGSWWDFLANALGALSTIPFSLWFRKHLLNKKLIQQEI